MTNRPIRWSPAGGWRLAACGSRLVPSRRGALAGDDGHAGAGADAVGPRLHHLLRVGRGADAAGRLDAHVVADHLPHERDVLGGGAAGTEAGAGLDERGTGRLRQRAADDLLLAVQRAGLEDDLDRLG